MLRGCGNWVIGLGGRCVVYSVYYTLQCIVGGRALRGRLLIVGRRPSHRPTNTQIKTLQYYKNRCNDIHNEFVLFLSENLTVREVLVLPSIDYEKENYALLRNIHIFLKSFNKTIIIAKLPLLSSSSSSFPTRTKQLDHHRS